MKFVNENTGRFDQIGGLPTHIPDEFPKGVDGELLAFIAQFEVAAPHLPIPGIGLIQIYQSPDGDPWPTVVLLNENTHRNTKRSGLPHPLLPEREIIWKPRDEPVEPADWVAIEQLPSTEEGMLQVSKAAGFCYYDSAIEPGEKFLLQLCEADLTPRIFGGRSLVLLMNPNDEIEARLG